MKPLRIAILGVGTAGCMAAAIIALRPAPVPVDTAVANNGLLESVISADGRTRVRARYTLVAPVSGRIERIELSEGIAVRTGQIVASVMPAPLDSEGVLLAEARTDAAAAVVAEIEGQDRVARATLDLRRRELSRAQRLLEAGGIAPRVAEEHQLAVTEAEQLVQSVAARTAAARANLREAGAQLRSRAAGTPVLLRAPVSGQVLRVVERSERIIAAGTPVMEIGDPGSLEVVMDLLTSDASEVSPGDVVRFDLQTVARGTDERGTLKGRVRTIEPAGVTKVSALGIEEQRVNVVVDLTDVPLRIGDGYRVDGNIVVWSRPDALMLPRSALIRDESAAGAPDAQSWSVFVVRRGRAERRAVRIGHVANLYAEVVKGIVAGDEVILYPQENLSAGARVRSRVAP